MCGFSVCSMYIGLCRHHNLHTWQACLSISLSQLPGEHTPNLQQLKRIRVTGLYNYHHCLLPSTHLHVGAVKQSRRISSVCEFLLCSMLWILRQKYYGYAYHMHWIYSSLPIENQNKRNDAYSTITFITALARQKYAHILANFTRYIRSIVHAQSSNRFVVCLILQMHFTY